MKTSFKLIALICATICFFSCKNSKQEENTPGIPAPDIDWVLDVIKFTQQDYPEYVLAHMYAGYELYGPMPVEEIKNDNSPWISLPDNYYLSKWYWLIPYFNSSERNILMVDKWIDLKDDIIEYWTDWNFDAQSLRNLYYVDIEEDSRVKDRHPFEEHQMIKVKSLWRFVNDETLMNAETMELGIWQDPRVRGLDAERGDVEKVKFVFDKSVEMLNNVIEAGRLNELIAFDKQVREQEAERFHGLNNQDPFPYSISNYLTLVTYISGGTTLQYDFSNLGVIDISDVEITSVQITDLEGNVIMTVEAGNMDSIDISSLPRGYYILTVVANGQTYTRQFYKRR